MQLKVPGYEGTFAIEVCRRRPLFMAQLFVLVFRIRVSQQLTIFTVTVATRTNIQAKWLMYKQGCHWNSM